jgi:VanZ family protein
MSLLADRLLAVVLRVPTPLRWLGVLAWAAMIFLASNQQGLAVTDDPGVDRPLRQLAHIGVYAVLTILLTWALTGPRIPPLRVAVTGGLLALLYGVTDEWHQAFVPTRMGRPEDLVWDGLGAVVAVGLIVAGGSAVTRRRARGA